MDKKLQNAIEQLKQELAHKSKAGVMQIYDWVETEVDLFKSK